MDDIGCFYGSMIRVLEFHQTKAEFFQMKFHFISNDESLDDLRKHILKSLNSPLLNHIQYRGKKYRIFHVLPQTESYSTIIVYEV